jgi:hypothetical protein
MAKMVIRDDCMTPDRYLRLKYTGPDPWGVAEFLNANLKEFFHVSSSKISNYRINWDVTGDPVSFYARWWARKQVSRMSMMKFIFKLVGEKGKVKNEGSFSLSYHARVITEVSGWGGLLKPFWSLYSYLFYNRLRRKYIEQCRNYMLTFMNTVKKHYNVEYNEIPMSRGF